MPETYAELPIPEMERWLKQLRDLERPIAHRALDLSQEAILSEAQVDAPVLTGFLKESHFADDSDRDNRVIGANTTYALVVHETHPTKSRWFVNAIQKNGRRILEGAIKLALGERGAR